MDTESVTVLVISAHPVIEGVVRLAAESTAAVDRIVAAPSVEALGATLTKEPSPVIVIDVDSAATGDLADVRSVRAASPGARIIVLSERTDGPQVLEAMRLGVRAFLRKPDGLRDIGDTLSQVIAGDHVVAPDLERSAVTELGRFARRSREGSDAASSITPRERQILELLAEGLTMQQMGRSLGISPRTVETHVANLYRKLAVRSRVQAVSRAASLGLIDLE